MPREELRLRLEAAGPHRGRLVIIEGMDGCGSTTQTRRLHRWLGARGIRAFSTHEPTPGPVGAMIRLALQGRLRGADPAAVWGGATSSSHQPRLDDRTLALLFAADRVDHLESEILPQLATGAWVISDRYVLSSLVYQGDRLPLSWVESLNAAAPSPDLTLYLDVELDVALERLRQTRWMREVTEEEVLLGRVLDRYRRLASSPPVGLGEVVFLDGNRSMDEVEQAIRERVEPLLV